MNRKDIFMSGFRSKLTYPFNHKDLAEFETIVNFYEKENQKYKEVINKAVKYIEENKQHEYRNGNLDEYYLELNEKEMIELLDILKEVEDKWMKNK